MGRQVIGDHVNLSPLRLAGHDVAEELDKGGARVPRRRLPEHFARLRIQRGKQRERPVPLVLEAVPLGAARRQRQHGIEAVEGLDRRFLIHREHGRVVGRIHVQPDHVRRFGFEIGIIRLHVALEPMRLQARALPRLRDQIVMNPEQATQLADTPVRTAVGGRLPRLPIEF